MEEEEFAVYLLNAMNSYDGHSTHGSFQSVLKLVEEYVIERIAEDREMA